MIADTVPPTGRLDAADEAALCRLVADRYGILIRDHQRSDLFKAVERGRRHFQCPSLQAYCDLLHKAPPSSPELDFLVPALTVGETYFFRDQGQLDFIKDRWLPRLLASKRKGGDCTVRVWSAGCATGEEAYTLAILLQESLPANAGWRFQVIGTDINVRALAMAGRGRYRPWALRTLPPAMRARYFTPIGSEFRIAPQFRDFVRFGLANLTTGLLPPILDNALPFDLILCRNVFIYLTRDAIARTTAGFAAALAPGGVLMLGAADPMDLPACGLTLQQEEKTFLFTRADSPVAVAPLPPPLPRQPPRQRLQMSDRQPAAGRPVVTPGQPGRTADLACVTSLLDQRQWSAALLAANAQTAAAGEQARLLECRAKALAHLGRHLEAAETCEQSLLLDRTRPEVHFLLGLVLVQLGRQEDAEQALRRALFLDHRFAEAHVQLGLLLLRTGRHGAGLHSLRTALDLARRQAPELPLKETSGLTYGDLATALEADMEIYAGMESKVSEVSAR